jgi:hypothetical protein
MLSQEMLVKTTDNKRIAVQILDYSYKENELWLQSFEINLHAAPNSLLVLETYVLNYGNMEKIVQPTVYFDAYIWNTQKLLALYGLPIGNYTVVMTLYGAEKKF